MSSDSQASEDGSVIDVADLKPPKGEQDPRITRDSEHTSTLKERFSRGFIDTLMFTVEDKFIVDGNYRRKAMIQLAEYHDDPSYRQAEVLGERDGYAYAVPVNDIEIDPETASMELNLYRQNNSQADCAKFLKYLIESRIISVDQYDVAGDTTVSTLLGQLEHYEDNSRPDKWNHSEEVKNLLQRFMQDLDFGSPENARKYVTLLENASEQVKQAWAREEIGQSHVQQLNEIQKHTDNEELNDYLQKTISGNHTRDDLRKIKSKLQKPEDTPPKEDSPGNQPEDSELNSIEDLDITEEQREAVEFILSNRKSLSRSEYAEELAEADDLTSKVQEDAQEVQEWLESGKNTSVKERMEKRKKDLQEYDFNTESSFASGQADHLAPPIETKNLGVFFHDCQQMDDEIEDESVQLVFTSPPYFTQRGRLVDDWWPEDQEQTQANADTAYENYLNAMMEVIEQCHSKLNEGGHLLLNVSDYQVSGIEKVYDIPSDFSYRIRNSERLEFRYISTLTWDKGDAETSSRLASFRSSNNISEFKPAWRTERILVLQKGSDRDGKEYQVDRSKLKDYRKEMDPFTDLWKVAPTTARDAAHESGFPVELPYLAVKLFTYPGETVIDPFGGWGTTLRAIKKINEENSETPPRKGFAWENFASETSDQVDYRKQIQSQLGGLGSFMT